MGEYLKFNVKKDDSIAAFLHAIYPLSKKALTFITSNSYSVNLRKGEYLLKPGYNDDQLFLLKKGVVRGFMRDGKKEITTWINEENEVVTSIRNLGLHIPAMEYIQAIDHCTLTGISYSAIEYLYENFSSTNKIGRLILEDSYRAAEERAYLCRLASAEKRYRRFAETNASLFNRIPLKFIASYLNMNLETLCRIRRKTLLRKTAS